MVFGDWFFERQLGLNKVMKDPQDEINALKRDEKAGGLSLLSTM